MDVKHYRHYFFLGLLFVILAINLVIFYPFLGPFVFAGTFAVLFRPWYESILSRMSRYPSFAAVLTMSLILVIIVAPLLALGYIVFSQAQEVYLGITLGTLGGPLGGLVEYVTASYPALADVQYIIENIGEYFQSVLGFIVGNFGTLFSGLTNVVINLFITLIALFFFLRDGSQLRSSIIQVSPLNDSDDKIIFGKLERVTSSVIKGSLVVALAQGISAGLGLFIFGVPQAALWGAVATLTSLIPGIGTAVVMIPSAAYLYFGGSLPAAIGLLVWAFIIVGTIDNLLRPKLIGEEAGIHPFLILISVLGGLTLFGIYGFLLGPLLLGFLIALVDLYKRELVPHPLE